MNRSHAACRLSVERLEGRELLSATPDLGLVPDGVLSAGPFAAPLTTAASAGFNPAQIRHAYGVDQTSYTGAGETIAIVDAYNDSHVLPDLQAFDRQWGIPDPPSYVKYNFGSTADNSAWGPEIALDVEWAHAMAPQANILLVEAQSNSWQDLTTAINYARQQPGVAVVSMSFSGPEPSNLAAMDSPLQTPANHKGITFVTGSGDSGTQGGQQYPASSPNVLTVGGTKLFLASNGSYSSETTWGNSGGGYSNIEAEPAYQTSVQHTGKRGYPDVAIDAGPATGVWVDYNGKWYVYGGTSLGAPSWAGLIALADQGRAQQGRGSLPNAQASIYSLPTADFHDITTGPSNGTYSARPGWDEVTGRGSPNAARLIPDLIGIPNSAVVTGSLARATSSSPIPAGQAQPDVVLVDRMLATESTTNSVLPFGAAQGVVGLAQKISPHVGVSSAAQPSEYSAWFGATSDLFHRELLDQVAESVTVDNNEQEAGETMDLTWDAWQLYS